MAENGNNRGKLLFWGTFYILYILIDNWYYIYAILYKNNYIFIKFKEIFGILLIIHILIFYIFG